MSNNINEPKTLQGFNDYFAQDVRIRDFVKNIFKSTFEKYGYEPLETPALEYSEMMLGQSGSEAEKQYYRFEDNGGRDVMLKFEVMISMCRALAQNVNNITFPYKRYQIQPVWRAEKVQKGRYREFTQMDADTIGTQSMSADAEFIQMGLEILGKLGFNRYEARISNRKFLEGLTSYLGIPEDKFYGFSMSIDKLEKIGKDKVINELTTKRGVDNAKATQALEILQSGSDEDFIQTIESYRDTVGKTSIGKEALDELLEIDTYLKISEVESTLYRFDPTIARGLASYTGPVWEFNVIDGNVGSIGGAGRYDKAIGKYLGKDYPATGGSFGLERICDIIKDRGMLDLSVNPTKVLVTVFSDELLPESIKLANLLRENNISTLLYPEQVKLDKQIKFADKKNIPFVLIIGPDELATGMVQVKDMQGREQKTLSIEDLLKLLS